MQFKLFAPGLPPQRVVVVACLRTNEVDHFEFLLALGHSLVAQVGEGRSTGSCTIHDRYDSVVEPHSVHRRTAESQPGGRDRF